MEYIKDPNYIETRSMQIIESEMKDTKQFSADELAIAKRVIHTTADFEYEELIKFSQGCINKIRNNLKQGCKIYSDTNMIAVGVNRVLLRKHNIEIVNYVHDDDVKERAIEKGVTRSMVAMEKAFNDKNIGLYMIGNAPTALIKLIELSKENGTTPPPIIGVPVGFVGAKESKDMLMQNEDYSWISVYGRKGGSTVAVAIVNAILKLI